MPIYLASLNSGSNGNCYYIGNGKDNVLIDAGISCRNTERRLARLELSVRDVNAIFITHEHIDHIRGADVLSRKFGIPVYITEKTAHRSPVKLDPRFTRSFLAGSTVNVGSMTINPFPKSHDASEPHSFTVTSNGITAGVFTDIGIPCQHVINHFSSCHAAFLESNYDDEMLTNGRYPRHLKQRIRGMEGHLSNDQALDLFLTHRPPWMKLLILSHLSAENNRPELVQELFSRNSNGTKIFVASRHKETELFCVDI